jgi:hypothetical protein
MSETLRPSTLGEILDRTAQLYRRNFWLFAGVAAFPVGVIVALSALAATIWRVFFSSITVANFEMNGTLAILFVGIVLVAIPIYIAAVVFSYAGLTRAAASAHRGEAITIRSALGAVKPQFWRYLWFIILQGFIVGVLPASAAALMIGILIALAAAAGGGAASVAAGFVAVLFGIAAVVVIIWLGLSYSLGLPVCVVESKSAWESLQRSWKLSSGTRGRICLMYLLVGALAIAVSMIAAIPSMIVIVITAAHGNGAAQSSAAFVVAEIVRVVTDFLLQVLIAPVSWIALVLFYYDQRIRKEGFDIEWMMQQAGLTPPQAESEFAAPAFGLGLSQPASSAAPVPDAPGVSAPVAPPDTVEEP